MGAAFTKQNPSTSNSEFNALSFLVSQMLSRINVATLVKVVGVDTNGPVGASGTVDVLPLVDSVDNAGNSIPNATIYGVPFARQQGGVNALIIDPQVGDVGVCVFAESDISSVKSTSESAPPSSQRQFSMSDALYLGCWNNRKTPTRYIVISDDGVSIQADGDMTVDADNLTETIAGSVIRMASSVREVVPGSYEITVPEFTINGNLHVTGLVHCTWEGELIGVKFGGTGSNLGSTGGPGMVLAQLSPGAPVTVLPIGDLPIETLYTNHTPTPVPIGGIPAGSTFTSDTMQTMWDLLLYPYQVPSFTSLGIVGQTNPIEVGSSSNANPTFTWTSLNPGNIATNSINIVDITASTTLVSGHANSGSASTAYPAVTRTTASSERYQIQGTDTQAGTFNRDLFLNWQWRLHYGESPLTSLTGAEVVALRASRLATGFASTYAFEGGGYCYVAYPAAFGTATHFTDTLTGFNVPFEAPDTIAVTNAYGITTSYNVHRSSNSLGGAINIAVS